MPPAPSPPPSSVAGHSSAPRRVVSRPAMPLPPARPAARDLRDRHLAASWTFSAPAACSLAPALPPRASSTSGAMPPASAIATLFVGDTGRISRAAACARARQRSMPPRARVCATGPRRLLLERVASQLVQRRRAKSAFDDTPCGRRRARVSFGRDAAAPRSPPRCVVQRRSEFAASASWRSRTRDRSTTIAPAAATVSGQHSIHAAHASRPRCRLARRSTSGAMPLLRRDRPPDLA